MFVHGANLAQKEIGDRKYADEISRTLLTEIREQYNTWHQSNMSLIGPGLISGDLDATFIQARVDLLNQYKDFIDQQKYAEHFDSRSNLHSSVLEEFLYYLFKDLVSQYGERVLIGKSHTFKDLFFVPPNFPAMIERPHARIETKDHDFVIGVRVTAQISSYGNQHADKSNKVEAYIFDIPAVAIECKTYLDKTMLEGSSTAAEQLKARNPNALYIVVMEWIKLTESVNLRKYKVDQIYVLRKQRNTDREYRFAPSYQKNAIQPDAIIHLFNTVRSHLTSEWKGGIEFGLMRGWLI